jgi:uncharacterized protein (TIGR02118 family)
MTFKAMILLTRRPDMSHADFEDWWLNTHVPLARQLPGLMRAVFNVVNDPQDGDPDGITELWFASREEFEAAYASEIGKRVVEDSLANVSSRRRMFVGEHVVTSD